MAKLFTLEYHHGGRFETSGSGLLSYSGGSVHLYENVDPDYMSYFEMQDIAEGLGYERGSVDFYYRAPLVSGNESLRRLLTDGDVFEMFESNKRFALLKILLVKHVVNHGVTDVEAAVEDLMGDKDSSLGDEDAVLGDEDAVLGDAESTMGDDDVSLGFEDAAMGDKDAALAVLGDENVENEQFFYVDSEYAPSDELRSICGSSNDEVDGRYQDFDPQRDLVSAEIEVGMKFATPDDFRAALRHHAVTKGFDIKFKKNERKLITAVCKKECGWRIRASHTTNESCLSIKTLVKKHNCTRIERNHMASAEYIANRYLDSIRDNPNWESSSMRQTVIRELRCDVSAQKIYRAKHRGKEMVEGNHGEQYSNIRRYCKLILETNPGSVAKVCNYPSETEPRRFKRLFISYEAMHRNFREWCRPFIGVDGTFLKGPYGGHLLSAVGTDGNNNIFPLAIAIVEAENRDSWTWFMEELMNIVGPPCGLTFISDRQKGLLQTFDDVLEGADHRFCVKHMYDNFKQKFRGLQLKVELWNAARAYDEDNFKKHMQQIKEINVDAYDWLVKVPFKHWARSHFSTGSKCNVVVNNICESWNAVILKAREKPIITMLEWIRKHLMRRFEKKRSTMSACNGLLCPEIQNVLDKYKNRSMECVVDYNGDSRYEVEWRGNNEDVNMQLGTCTCREWDVTGIPCQHGVATILYLRREPEQYVAGYYLRDTYLMTYAPVMYPMPLKMMSKYTSDLIIPPLYPNPPGRPKKARRKTSDEVTRPTKLSKNYVNMCCSKCLQSGHNARTCKVTEPMIREKAPRGKGGRPKKVKPTFLGIDTSSGTTILSNVEVSSRRAGSSVPGRGRAGGSIPRGGRAVGSIPRGGRAGSSVPRGGRARGSGVGQTELSQVSNRGRGRGDLFVTQATQTSLRLSNTQFSVGRGSVVDSIAARDGLIGHVTYEPSNIQTTSTSIGRGEVANSLAARVGLMERIGGTRVGPNSIGTRGGLVQVRVTSTQQTSMSGLEVHPSTQNTQASSSR